MTTFKQQFTIVKTLQRCPHCDQMRGVVSGKFVPHYNNHNQVVIAGQGQPCAGSGQRATTVRGTAHDLFVSKPQ